MAFSGVGTRAPVVLRNHLTRGLKGWWIWLPGLPQSALWPNVLSPRDVARPYRDANPRYIKHGKSIRPGGLAPGVYFHASGAAISYNAFLVTPKTTWTFGNATFACWFCSVSMGS